MTTRSHYMPQDRLAALVAWVGLSATVALLATGCAPQGTGAAAGTAPPPNVVVERPSQQTVTDWAEFTGRLSAVESVAVRARVSGFVEGVHFDEGSVVAAGDLLFTLDSRPFRAELARLEAQRNEARVRLDLARSEAERVEPLIGSRAVSTEEVEQRRQSVETARAVFAAAEAALEGARLDLEFSRVESPIAGRVGRAMVTRGNLVSGGSGDATVLTTAVSIDPIYFDFTADERTALRLLESASEDAASVGLQLTDETGYPHEGVLDFFDNRIDPDSGTLRMRAVLPNPEGKLRPGMFGRLRVEIGEPRSALLVPDAAIGQDQTQKLLFVVGDDDVVERRVVTTGSLVDGRRVIESGIAASERIVVEGVLRVRPGGKVTPQGPDPSSGKPSENGAPDS